MRSQRGEVPGWLKVAIVVGVLIPVIGIVGITAFLFNMFSQAPERAAEVAREIVQIDEPLPAGWQFVTGSKVNFTKTVELKNDRAQVFIVQKPNNKHKTADQLAVVPSESESKVAWTKETEGETIIGEQKARYIRDRSSTNSEERIYVVLSNGKYVMIQTVLPTYPFDPSVNKQLLDCIKGFRVDSTCTIFYASRELKQGIPISKDSIISMVVDSDFPSSDCIMSLQNIVGKKPTVNLDKGRAICQCQFAQIEQPRSAGKTIVFVTRDIREGTLVSSDALEERPVSDEGKIPADAMSAKADVVGWVAKYGVPAGQIITSHDLQSITEVVH